MNTNINIRINTSNRLILYHTEREKKRVARDEKKKNYQLLVIDHFTIRIIHTNHISLRSFLYFNNNIHLYKFMHLWIVRVQTNNLLARMKCYFDSNMYIRVDLYCLYIVPLSLAYLEFMQMNISFSLQRKINNLPTSESSFC